MPALAPPEPPPAAAPPAPPRGIAPVPAVPGAPAVPDAPAAPADPASVEEVSLGPQPATASVDSTDRKSVVLRICPVMWRAPPTDQEKILINSGVPLHEPRCP
jgi:hypothetical protein